MTPQLTNKPEYITDTFKFKDVIQHVDIVQAEAEFVEKYNHLLDENNLIVRTIVDYKAKAITIEANNIRHFHSPKKVHNKGFIFDLNVAPSITDLDIRQALKVEFEEYRLYPCNHLVIITDKLTKQIIDDTKEVIALENRQETFCKSYKFDKRPTVKDLLDSQLEFLVSNKLHEDDITFTSIYSTDEENTITISGKQSDKYKTYNDDVAAVINSCVIINRFNSCLESALREGSNDVIERIISYQYPIVNDTSLELLEGPVDVNSSLQDVVESIPVEPNFPHESYQAMLEARLSNSIFSEVEGQDLSQEPIIEGNFPTNFNIADFATETLPKPEPQHPIVKDDTLELLEAPIAVDISQVLLDINAAQEQLTKLDINNEVAEFITDIPNNLVDMLAESEAYENLQKINDGIDKNDPLLALSLNQDEIQRLKSFLSNNKYQTVITAI
jgi:hypothetical protein